MGSVAADSRNSQLAEETESSEYGYEYHMPSPRRYGASGGEDDSSVTCGPGMKVYEAKVPVLDTTDVSYSPSVGASSSTLAYDHGENCCSMPADRLARKQRSFHRRGGELHANLLKSAVLASMEDFDDFDDEEDCLVRRGHESRNSNISLQSLQEALEKEGISPRKRARRKGEPNELADSINGMGFNNGTAVPAAQKKAGDITGVAPGPLVRRVSRRTSYDSRASAAESDVSFETPTEDC